MCTYNRGRYSLEKGRSTLFEGAHLICKRAIFAGVLGASPVTMRFFEK